MRERISFNSGPPFKLSSAQPLPLVAVSRAGRWQRRRCESRRPSCGRYAGDVFSPSPHCTRESGRSASSISLPPPNAALPPRARSRHQGDGLGEESEARLDGSLISTVSCSGSSRKKRPRELSLPRPLVHCGSSSPLSASRTDSSCGELYVINVGEAHLLSIAQSEPADPPTDLDRDLAHWLAPVTLAGAAAQPAELEHVGHAGLQSLKQDGARVLERDDRAPVTIHRLYPAQDRFAV